MEIKEYIKEYTARDIIKARNPSVVTIGGGTEMGEILRGLKKYTAVSTAIVAMGDDGRLREAREDVRGMLPPRTSATASWRWRTTKVSCQVCSATVSIRRARRAPSANLFLAWNGSRRFHHNAVKRTSDVLQIKGRVLPVTLGQMRLRAALENGHIISGESEIPKAAIGRRAR